MQKRLLASSEWRVVVRIDTFARSVGLLEANAEELRRAVHYLTEDPRSFLLQAVDAKEERDRWLNEAGRLLHNVLAAVKTLVDHTNALHKALYPSGEKFQDYTDRKRTLGQVPLVRFVQELRNLHLHRKLPNIVYVDRPGPGHTRTRHIVLEDDKLMLELLRTESLPSWVEGALHRIGETYGEVPPDIITRFLEVSRRSGPGDDGEVPPRQPS